VSGSSRVSHQDNANVSPASLQPASHALLLFRLSDRLAGFPVEDVERITPMAELGRPPGLPSALEGVLNLGSAAIPVLRLDRLLSLPEQRLGLYSMLIVLRAGDGGRIAILADRVNEILSVPNDGLRRIDEEDAFNGCAEAIATIRGEAVHVLCPGRIMLAKERHVLSEFQTMEQQRLEKWKVGEV
jgi:purine-binding chemotaxis protein CheW